MVEEVLNFRGVDFVRGGTNILVDVSWRVLADERWVVLGPNGSGKSTLLSLAGARQYPSRGSVKVLDRVLGSCEVQELRSRVGLVSRGVGRCVPDAERVLDVALTAAYSVFGRWRENYDELDVRQAKRVLGEWQLTDLEGRAFGSLSDGERGRALIARAVMTDPELLLLDEPAASLDLGARERLVTMLGRFAVSTYSPAMILVTHHVEEIPAGFTHALLLADGRVVAQGGLDSVLTSNNLARTFGVPLELHRDGSGRFTARAVGL